MSDNTNSASSDSFNNGWSKDVWSQKVNEELYKRQKLDDKIKKILVTGIYIIYKTVNIVKTTDLKIQWWIFK